MSQKLAKSAAELESMIMAELREHPECDSAAVEVTSKEIGWDAVLVRAGTQLNDPCEAMLVEITERLRREFDLSEEPAASSGRASWGCDVTPQNAVAEAQDRRAARLFEAEPS